MIIRARLIGALVVLLAATAGCTGRSGPRQRVGTATAPGAPTSGSASFPASSEPAGPPRSVTPCLDPLPASWAAAERAGTLWSGVADEHPSYVPMSDGSGVLFEDVDRAHRVEIEIRGRGHRVVRRVGSLPDPAGTGQITFNAARGRWVAFTWSPDNGNSSSYVWDLYLWNSATGRLRLVAHNPVDAAGQPLPGGWVQPALTDSGLYWIQAAPNVGTHGWGGSALMGFGFSTGRVRTLYQGLTLSFVPYGKEVLFGALPAHVRAPAPTDTSGPPQVLDAVDPATGRQVSPPAGITFAQDEPNSVFTDATTIVWSTDLVIRAWRPAWGASTTVVPDGSDASAWPAGNRLQVTGPSYPRVHGDLLAWQAGGGTFVLDLRTHAFTRLDSLPGNDDLSGSELSVEHWADAHGPARSTGLVRNDEMLLDLAELAPLPACGAH